MTDSELIKELKELEKKAKELPFGSEERLEIEIEMAELAEWLPLGKHDFIGWA